MMRFLRKFSSVIRSLDPHYSTNRAILVIGAAATMLFTILQGLASNNWLQGGLAGLLAGISVGFAWALGRELDPDHEYAAFVGAGMAILGLYLFSLPNLLILLWLLLVMRTINRTTGLPATIVDSTSMLALGGWLAYSVSWIFGALTALAFILDAALPEPHRRQYQDAVFAIILTIAMFTLTGEFLPAAGLSLPAGVLAVALSLVFVPLLLNYRQVVSVGDDTQLPLIPRRMQSAQILALLAGIILALWSGTAGLTALMPFWVTVVGTGVFWLVQRLFVNRK